jgi:glycosyltransferase involved in cell wall biosynthesis
MLVDLYNSHDLVIVPSRWETFSYVCLEAQSCGIPVIATRIPGPTDIIKHEKTGLLIPPEDWTALADAILYLQQLKEKEKCAFNKIKKRSRENVMKKHSLEIATHRLESLFLNLLNEN